MSIGLNVAIINIIVCSVISYTLAPLVNLLGIKFNIVDIPNQRKVHKKPIVRIGGLTIFTVFSLYLLITSFFVDLTDFDSQIFSKFYIFLIGALSFFIIGIHDDIFKSSPLVRLFLQFSVAIFISFNGINFGALNLYLPYFGQIDLFINPFINHIFSAIWIVGATNSNSSLTCQKSLARLSALSLTCFSSSPVTITTA